MKRIFYWNEVKELINRGASKTMLGSENKIDQFEEYAKDETKKWSFVTWSSPGYNAPSMEYTIKKCKDCDAGPFSLWLIHKCPTGVEYRYRIEAKDEESYLKLLS